MKPQMPIKNLFFKEMFRQNKQSVIICSPSGRSKLVRLSSFHKGDIYVVDKTHTVPVPHLFHTRTNVFGMTLDRVNDDTFLAELSLEY